MNAHFAIKDLESAWEWIGRPPITEAHVTAVSAARPGYFDIACRRIDDAQRQQRMFA